MTEHPCTCGHEFSTTSMWHLPDCAFLTPLADWEVELAERLEHVDPLAGVREAIRALRADFAAMSDADWLGAVAFPDGPDGPHLYGCTDHLHGDGSHCVSDDTLGGDPKFPRRCKWCEARCAFLDGLPEPAPDGVRPFLDLRVSGLLWLINAAVFHPRGFALAVHVDAAGKAVGWKLQGDGSQPWRYNQDMDHRFAAAEETLRAAREREES